MLPLYFPLSCLLFCGQARIKLPNTKASKQHNAQHTKRKKVQKYSRSTSRLYWNMFQKYKTVDFFKKNIHNTFSWEKLTTFCICSTTFYYYNLSLVRFFVILRVVFSKYYRNSRKNVYEQGSKLSGWLWRGHEESKAKLSYSNILLSFSAFFFVFDYCQWLTGKPQEWVDEGR